MTLPGNFITAIYKDPGIERYRGNPFVNEQAMRLYHLLIAMDCNAELLPPLIDQAFKDYPKLTIRELMPVVLEWYEKPVKPKAVKKRNKIPQKSWHTLESDDLRFKFSQADKDRLYDDLKYGNELFDLPDWIKRAG